MPQTRGFGQGPRCTKTLALLGRGKTQIYSYIRTSRAAVDGLAGMHPETQVQVLADAGVPTLPASDCSLTSTSLTALTRHS